MSELFDELSGLEVHKIHQRFMKKVSMGACWECKSKNFPNWEKEVHYAK